MSLFCDGVNHNMPVVKASPQEKLQYMEWYEQFKETKGTVVHADKVWNLFEKCLIIAWPSTHE